MDEARKFFKTTQKIMIGMFAVPVFLFFIGFM